MLELSFWAHILLDVAFHFGAHTHELLLPRNTTRAEFYGDLEHHRGGAASGAARRYLAWVCSYFTAVQRAHWTKTKKAVLGPRHYLTVCNIMIIFPFMFHDS